MAVLDKVCERMKESARIALSERMHQEGYTQIPYLGTEQDAVFLKYFKKGEELEDLKKKALFYSVEGRIYNEGGYCFGGWKTLGIFPYFEDAESHIAKCLKENTFFKICSSEGEPEIDLYLWTSNTYEDKERILQYCSIHQDTSDQ